MKKPMVSEKQKQEEVRKMLGVSSRINHNMGVQGLKNKNVKMLDAKKMEAQWKKWEARSNELIDKE